jgi:hypothetical protein
MVATELKADAVSDEQALLIFTFAAKRLADGQIGLNVLVKHLFRVYGLETCDIEITDEQGDALLTDYPGLVH